MTQHPGAGVQIPFPVLAVDVGGTNARFALFEAPDGPAIPLPAQATAAHPGLAHAARVALTGAGRAPRSILACAAGPVVGRGVKLTNASWSIDGPAVAAALGLDQGLLFNDFEAQALSIPALRPEWLRPIGAPLPAAAGPRLIHGPGTGLGTAALVDAGGKWLAIASEASHSDFAPVTPEERAFWPHVQRVHGRLTPEALISGPGIVRLHEAIAGSLCLPSPGLAGEAIVARALANHASPEADTIRAFWRLAARFAGDMAMAFVATGGVILAGGILPRIVDLLDETAFRAAFEDRAPYVDFAKRLPVSLLTGKDTVLHGLAAVAAAPQRYAIDYAARAWR